MSLQGLLRSSYRHILIAGAMLSVLLMCSSCSMPQKSVDKNDKGSMSVQDITQFTEREGKTGVVLEDCMLEDCFALTYEETEGTAVEQKQGSIETMDNQNISAGDIVLILDENPAAHVEMARVMLPYGDAPNTYGYISNEQLSTEWEDIQKGNQALVTDCDCYDKPDGSLTEIMSGVVQILSYDKEWCQVEQLGTGAEAVWVRTDQLSFDFNQSVMDIAQ